MKKKLLSIFLVFVMLIGMLAGCGSQEESVVANVLALKGPTGMGIVKMIADEAEADEENYNFTIAASVDEVIPKIVNKEADIAAVPANMSSVLYNNTDGEIVTLGINTLGVLYIVENGETINSIEDLKGKTIYASGKGATPEYALNYILKENGLENDVTIEWKSEHAECLSAVMKNPQGIAMLPQPFVTVALTKSDKLRVALDLTEEWDKISKDSENGSALVTGVVIARKEFVEKYPNKVKSFLEAYAESVDFTNENIEEAAKLIAENGIVEEQVAVKAIPKCNITFISGEEMKEMLSGYLNVLYEANPKAIGGNMPGDDFYYMEEK